VNRTRIVKLIRWTAIPVLLALAVIILVSLRQRTKSGQSAAPTPSLAQEPGRPSQPTANPSAAAEDEWNTWKDRIGSYTAKDFQALAEAAIDISDPARRQTILAQVLTAWLKSDARSFHKYFMALEVSNESAKLGLLAAALKPALAELAENIPTSDTLKEIVRRMIAHLARDNPRDALEWASIWLKGDTHDSALVQIMRPLAEQDPARALRELANISSPLRHMQALAAIGGAWAKTEADAAAAWAAQIPAPTDRAMAMNAVLLSIAQNNPAEAATRLADAESIMLEEYLLNYRASLAALNLTEADLANDPDSYMEMRNAGSLPPPNSPDVELMGEAARVIASKLANNDPAAGANWAEALESEYLKLTAMKGALAGWSRSEPQAAVEYFTANYTQSTEILSSLFSTWATSDPGAAASGVSLLDNATNRSIATETVAKTWATVDPAGAARWIDQLPQAQQTDQARLAVATALSPTNPQEAWNRGLEIMDASTQYKALKTALSEMVSVDPSAARALLASAQLSATNVSRLSELLLAVQ